nr:MAG: replication associated protein [Cressdnaviricota sp.]
MQSRNWCFTLNNPTARDYNQLCPDNLHWGGALHSLTYALEHETTPSSDSTGQETSETWSLTGSSSVLQPQETCPLTPHLQGYLELNSSRQLTWMKMRLPRAHLEKRKGTQTQALIYCLKEVLNPSDNNKGMTIGFHNLTNLWDLKEKLLSLTSKPVKVVTREVLLHFQKMMKNGAKLADLADYDFPVFLSKLRQLHDYKLLITPPRDYNIDKEIVVVYGASGTGKSRWAHDTYPNAYSKTNTEWWDLYDNHETVIWDEFDGSACDYKTFLKVMDRYPLLCPVKGSFVQLTCNRIILISNYRPSAWYQGVYLEAFIRRVTKYMVFGPWLIEPLIIDTPDKNENYNNAIRNMRDHEPRQ